MLHSESLQGTETKPPVRCLRVEADGDCWKGIVKPKIRLAGRWLEPAGFPPNSQVEVICLAPGVIELRAAGRTILASL